MKQFLLVIIVAISLFVYISNETCDSTTLVTDFSLDSCIKMMTKDDSYYYSLDETTCVPSCQKYDVYVDDMLRPCKKNDPCPPAYSCQPCNYVNCTGKMCLPDTTSCMAYYVNTTDYQDNYFAAYEKPSCENDATWKAKQCRGGITGKCVCNDKHGNRIFGEALFEESKDMTCSCSRRRAELMESGRTFVSFHCDQKGNYEKMQCASGLCWCVEPKNGKLTSLVVPEKVMKMLPCYEFVKTGNQYLRQCDSVLAARDEISVHVKKHGVTYVHFERKPCDGDGAYGNFNVSNNIAYCTWRDLTKLKTWQSDSSADLSTINCNCARDYKRYDHSLTCNGDGSYRDWQSVIYNLTNLFFCVDENGFRKTTVLDTRPENCSNYF